MLRFLSTLILGVALLAPTVLMAQDQNRHVWNDQRENASWHQYLKERHKKDHDWAKANKKEQGDYWKWRDAHPDTH